MQTATRSGPSVVVVMSAILFVMMMIIIALFMMFEQQSFQLIVAVTDELSANGGYALLAVFLVAALACDIVLPIPSSIVAVVAASTLGMWFGAGVIWVGLMISCVIGYYLGAGSGHFMLKSMANSSDFERAKQFASKIGAGALVVMRGVPVLAETSTIAAGLVGFPVVRFVIVCALANAGLALAYGYVGAKADEQGSFLYVLLASIVVPASAWGINFVWRRVMGVTLDERIEVKFNLPQHYPVIFEHDVFATDNHKIVDLLCQQGKGIQKVMVVVDDGVVKNDEGLIKKISHYFDHHTKQLQLVSAVQVIQGGEQGKSFLQVQSLYQHMLTHQLDRHSYVIAIGGGAVLDVVGFACATFHRGIKLVRMPSTVLAQNDAGVGVKNGFNWSNTKNLIGTFAPPNAVLNDSKLLETLAVRDKRAGLAEAIKVALIRDGEFFTWMERNVDALAQFESTASHYAIVRCAQLHLKQISQAGDPFETGSARPLDYGHWLAHKLEAMSDYQIRHGEAVAIGMLLDAQYAANIGMLSRSEVWRLTELLQQLGFTLWHPALEQLDANGVPLVLAGLEEFRQHLGGQLCVTLLQSLGEGREVDTIDITKMTKALDWLQQSYQPASIGVWE